MHIQTIHSKIKENEDAQDKLLLSKRKFNHQYAEARQFYLEEKKLKETVLEYFYGEPEQYLFETGLEKSRQNEQIFLENSENILSYFSKEKLRLQKENDDLYIQKQKELKEGNDYG